MMKNTGNIRKSFIIVFLFICSTVVYAQNSNPTQKIKSRVTHEEKTEKGVKKTEIDAEEKYDLKGNVIEEINYKDGKIDKRVVYEYDSDNNKTRETEYDATGKLDKTGEYKYVGGLRTEKYIYDKNKKLVSRKTYTYTY